MKSIETKFSEAMSALDKIGKREVFSEKAATLTTIESKLNCAEEVLKGSRYVRKHNGPSDNSHDEGYVQEHDPRAVPAGDRLQAQWLFDHGKITEAERRKLCGEEPAEVATFSESQLAEYKFSRACGISEADSLKLAKMKTVGRRI